MRDAPTLLRGPLSHSRVLLRAVFIYLLCAPAPPTDSPLAPRVLGSISTALTSTPGRGQVRPTIDCITSCPHAHALPCVCVRAKHAHMPTRPRRSTPRPPHPPPPTSPPRAQTSTTHSSRRTIARSSSPMTARGTGRPSGRHSKTTSAHGASGHSAAPATARTAPRPFFLPTCTTRTRTADGAQASSTSQRCPTGPHAREAEAHAAWRRGAGGPLHPLARRPSSLPPHAPCEGCSCEAGVCLSHSHSLRRVLPLQVKRQFHPAELL